MTQKFKKWLENLGDSKAKALIARRIHAIEQDHPTEGDIKSLGNGLQEMRFYIGPGYRIYFITVQDTLLLLLMGGNKSSQRRDIAKARKLSAKWKGVVANEG